MSDETVERVRRGYEVFNRVGIEGMVEEFWANDIVMDSTTADLPGAGVYNGLDELREFFSNLFSVWEYWEQEPTQILQAGDRILVFATVRARGAVSGAAAEMDWAQLLTLRNEKVVRIQNYTDRAKALEDAGLSGRGC
jgi:ketosteroid isomerase-like protein